jgi:hypothetical protein
LFLSGEYECKPNVVAEKFTNTRENFADACAGISDDATGVSRECQKQIWKDSGCTTQNDGNEWADKQTKATLVNDGKAWATLTGSDHRKGCYGADQSKWPDVCDTPDNYKSCGDDQFVTREVYSQIWQDAGCTAPNGGNEWTDKQTKGTLVNDSKAWATMTDPDHRKGCYGADQSKWPK